jgi:hypothetical protein
VTASWERGCTPSWREAAAEIEKQLPEETKLEFTGVAERQQ